MDDKRKVRRRIRQQCGHISEVWISGEEFEAESRAERERIEAEMFKEGQCDDCTAAQTKEMVDYLGAVFIDGRYYFLDKGDSSHAPSWFCTGRGNLVALYHDLHPARKREAHDDTYREWRVTCATPLRDDDVRRLGLDTRRRARGAAV